MLERPLPSDTSWYELTIAGRKFSVASRHGEAHIREVERLLEETYREVTTRLPGQTALNLALLTALNLADQVLTLNTKEQQQGQSFERVQGLLSRLETVLDVAPRLDQVASPKAW